MVGQLSLNLVEKTDHQAWLLAQHADLNGGFQANMAILLEQLSAVGESDRKNAAYLYDRVLVHMADDHPSLEIKQKFGTQASLEGGTVRLKPYNGTLKDLNMRRKKVGLGPVEKQLEQLKATYTKGQKSHASCGIKFSGY